MYCYPMYCYRCGNLASGCYWCPGSGADRYAQAELEVRKVRALLSPEMQEALDAACNFREFSNKEREAHFDRAMDLVGDHPIKGKIRQMKDHFNRRGRS